MSIKGKTSLLGKEFLTKIITIIMKRCDLHIHTVASVSDRAFVYDKEVLKDYVEKTGLDVIAITNHNLFDYGQFNYGSITDTLPSKDQGDRALIFYFGRRKSERLPFFRVIRPHTASHHYHG